MLDLLLICVGAVGSVWFLVRLLRDRGKSPTEGEAELDRSGKNLATGVEVGSAVMILLFTVFLALRAMFRWLM